MLYISFHIKSKQNFIALLEVSTEATFIRKGLGSVSRGLEMGYFIICKTLTHKLYNCHISIIKQNARSTQGSSLHKLLSL
jgi:hypothetical protein